VDKASRDLKQQTTDEEQELPDWWDSSCDSILLKGIFLHGLNATGIQIIRFDKRLNLNATQSTNWPAVPLLFQRVFLLHQKLAETANSPRFDSLYKAVPSRTVQSPSASISMPERVQSKAAPSSVESARVSAATPNASPKTPGPAAPLPKTPVATTLPKPSVHVSVQSHRLGSAAPITNFFRPNVPILHTSSQPAQRKVCAGAGNPVQATSSIPSPVPAKTECVTIEDDEEEDVAVQQKKEATTMNGVKTGGKGFQNTSAEQELEQKQTAAQPKEYIMKFHI